jgi:hypothetical protein
VSPKVKALDKIFTALFFRLPHDICNEDKSFKLSRRTFLEIAGLLTWYGEVLRVGKSFVHSLFACAGWGSMEMMQTVSLNAKRDIGWWKVIAVASMRDPYFMSASISHLRRDIGVDCYLITDASTTIGCGGWFSSSNVYNEDDMPIYEGFLRWTEDELAAFAIGVNGKPIDINVMEYFAVVYFVMMAGSRLRGKRVGIKCDNTAAVAWLQKSRASTSSPIGELLVQTFALYCIAMDITLVPSHVAGIKNVRADDLSRNVFLQESQSAGDPSQRPLDLKDPQWWKGQRREVVCRQFLMASISMPWNLHWSNRLSLLSALL